MEYQEVKCKNCGSPMHVAEGAERIRCPYCGTEYILNSRNRQENSIHVINYGGRGALFLCHSSGSAVSSCEAVFDRFLKELKYGPLYFALQDEELQRARQIQLQGAMVRQQNAIHASQNLSHTLSQTSDIVNQACQDHSRQMDHIYDHSTDGIRGVEHYRDSYGNAYQADVKYDHIYKNGNTFVASTDGSLQLGPDWEELKK